MSLCPWTRRWPYVDIVRWLRFAGIFLRQSRSICSPRVCGLGLTWASSISTGRNENGRGGGGGRRGREGVCGVRYVCWGGCLSTPPPPALFPCRLRLSAFPRPPVHLPTPTPCPQPSSHRLSPPKAHPLTPSSIPFPPFALLCQTGDARPPHPTPAREGRSAHDSGGDVLLQCPEIRDAAANKLPNNVPEEKWGKWGEMGERYWENGWGWGKNVATGGTLGGNIGKRRYKSLASGHGVGKYSGSLPSTQPSVGVSSSARNSLSAAFATRRSAPLAPPPPPPL